MNQKQIGIILLVFSLLIGFTTMANQIREEKYIEQFTLETGSCFLEDGTCLHDKKLPYAILGWTLTSLLAVFGIYLSLFDKTQEKLAEHQIKISSYLESSKKLEKEKDEFNAFLSGFNEEEKSILKAIKEQEGIKQSTLRYKTNLTKTDLSLILKSLEERKIVSRKVSGKTKEVYLVKKF